MEDLKKVVVASNGILSVHENFDSELQTKDIEEITGQCGGGFKASEAFVKSDGSSASPNITIRESTIWVYHGQQGGGRITGTTLRGSGGTYNFVRPGKYNVQPGTYDHFVNGTIYNNGWIGSGICYK